MLKTLLAALVAVALISTTSWAENKVIRDADGNKWIIDTETAATPGAGSGSGALIGAVDDTLAAFEKHKFDLQIGLALSGVAGDDSSGTETALGGVTLYYRVERWFRIGPEMTLNTLDNDAMRFGVPMGFLINPDPWSKYNFWLFVDILPKFTVRTDELEFHKSAWSWIPCLAIKGEIPMGTFSVEGGFGAAFPFAIEGVTDPDINGSVEQVGFQGNIGINYRLGR